MDERFVKKLLVPSCLIIVLSTAFVYELKSLIDVLFFKKKHFLIIGILSAPENFEQRLSIRKTWLQLLTEISGSAYFIVGNEICEVPPYDRIDPYTCQDRPFALPPNATPQTEFTTMNVQEVNLCSKPPVTGFIGFGFYVRRSIVVKKLGILKELLPVLKSEVQVKLISAISNTVLASVVFSSELLRDSTNSTVLMKAIKPVFLNARFEAIVRLEAKDVMSVLLPACDSAVWQSEPYVIHFTQLWDERSVMPQPFTEKSCSFSFMTYSVVDTEHIVQQTSNRTLRLKEWYRLNKKLSLKLQKESDFYNDILFVDVIDVYRNLSRKMTDFYKSIVETEYFHYVLKADDDSFIDLLRVYNQLKTVSRETDCELNETAGNARELGILTRLRSARLWWWSFFKEFWKVERSGKWRETRYRSASYPTFPCGGGYVLSRGIVDYIAANGHNLHHFQGEDVSVGIWVSPLPVTQYKTPRVMEANSGHLQKRVVQRFRGRQTWMNFSRNKTNSEMASDLCEWTCNRRKSFSVPLCNRVQLSVAGMYATWRDYIAKGYL